MHSEIVPNNNKQYLIMKYYKITWKFEGRKYEIIERFPLDLNFVECFASFLEHTSNTCYSSRTEFVMSPLDTFIVKK